MEFACIYQHGFVRVAACTGPTAIADPPALCGPYTHDAGAAVGNRPCGSASARNGLAQSANGRTA